MAQGLDHQTDVVTFWVGTRAVDMIPFDRIIPIQGVVTCDYGGDVEQIEDTRFVVSLEKDTKVRHPWSNFHVNYLFRGRQQRRLEEYVSTITSPIQFLCYSSSGLLEQLLLTWQRPARNLSIPVQTRMLYDDKILLHYKLRRLGFRTITTSVVELGSQAFVNLEKKLGGSLVVKLPVGSAGGNIFYISSADQLKELQRRHSSKTAIIQQYRSGVSINVQGVVHYGQVWVAPASMQIIGSPECTSNVFEWCGNDFAISSYVPEYLLSEAYEITRTLGIEMAADGYVGIYGVDLLIDRERKEVFVLEINPRHQGSTALLTQLELLNSSENFFLEHHIRALNGITPSASIPVYQERTLFNQVGSQVILHSKFDRPKLVTRSLRPGIYTIDALQRQLIYIREGLSLLDCINSSEFVISGGVPLVGQIVMPGAAILWIQTLQGALKDPLVGKLKEGISQVCQLIYDNLDFQDLPEDWPEIGGLEV